MDDGVKNLMRREKSKYAEYEMREENVQLQREKDMKDSMKGHI